MSSSAQLYAIAFDEASEIGLLEKASWAPIPSMLFAGKPLSSTWKPLKVQLVAKDKKRKLTFADAPTPSSKHYLILRSSVVEAIGHELTQFGELLPLECATANLYAYNVTRLLDVLDVERSVLKRFSTGDIMSVYDYAFRDLPTPVNVFKISDLGYSDIFVGQEFVDLWTSRGFTGLRFRPVWPRL